MARSTWALLDEELVEHLMANNCGNAKEWLFFLLDTLSHDDFVRVTVTLWAIWTARRKAIHEQVFQSPMTIVGFIRSFLSDMKLALDVPTNSSPGIRQQTVPVGVQWSVPPQGMCEVNVDAALSKSSIAGSIAAVCRDEHGVLLGSSARIIEGIQDPATLEACACAEGLSLAADLNVRRLCLATDCLVVAREINEGSKASYATILMEIAERLIILKLLKLSMKRDL
jgi:hypothetical protein